MFTAIGNVIKAVAPQFADFIDGLANGDVDTEQWEQLGEAIAVIAGIIIGVIAVLKVFAAVQAIVNGRHGRQPHHLDYPRHRRPDRHYRPLDKELGQGEGSVPGSLGEDQGCLGQSGRFLQGYLGRHRRGVQLVVSWFGNLFRSAWEGIVNVWNTVVGWFQGIWSGITGVFSSVVSWFTGIFSQAWEGIKSVFSTVGEFFQGIWNTIVNLFTTIGTAVGDAISGAVKGAINAVLSGAITIINGFISAINLAIGIINAIPGVEIKKLDKLEVPQLAQGGFVRPNKPQAVVIGDNKHEGEIVSPISKMRDTVLDAMQMFSARCGRRRARSCCPR